MISNDENRHVFVLIFTDSRRIVTSLLNDKHCFVCQVVSSLHHTSPSYLTATRQCLCQHYCFMPLPSNGTDGHGRLLLSASFGRRWHHNNVGRSVPFFFVYEKNKSYQSLPRSIMTWSTASFVCVSHDDVPLRVFHLEDGALTRSWLSPDAQRQRTERRWERREFPEES